MNLIGEKLGNYEVVELIGQGGMAAVYRAVQTTLNRPVAIKVLAGLSAGDEVFRQRFDREAKAVARLSHPNIVPIYDFGSDDQRQILYIVMEYVTGGNLRDLARQQPLAVDDAVRFIAQIAFALEYAHARGIVHRDIKPSNVLLTESRRPMLSDFGLAKLETHPHFTESGLTIGTPAYMSPEQVMGSDLDRRSDVYSLAMVLYELLAGRGPFRADTSLALLHQQVYETPEPPRKLNPRISRRLERVVLRALRKRREDRYATAAEFALELGKTVRGGVATLSSVSSLPAVAVPPPQPILPEWLHPARWRDALQTRAEQGVDWLLPRAHVAARRAARWTVRAIIITAVLVILGLSAAALLLSALAENAVDAYRSAWVPPTADQPTVLSEATVAAETARFLKGSPVGVFLDRTVVHLADDELVEFTGEGALGTVRMEARLFVVGGAVQAQIESVNGLTPYVLGSVVTEGLNRGLRQLYSGAAVRLERVETSGGQLVLYPRKAAGRTLVAPTAVGTPTPGP